MSTALLALGLVLCVEGAILALLPDRLEALLETLRAMPVEARRLAGLLALVVGLGLVLSARGLAA